jgi:uncharacterized protein (TIGR03118 family)
MNLPPQCWRRLFPGKRAVPDRRRPCRPELECLEDRWLLAAGFTPVNLASDVPGLARVTDPNLVNPWGLASSATGPFWFADNGSGVADLLDGRGQPLPLVVPVPSAAGPGGTPTGTVFNGGSGFVLAENGTSAPSRFLFAAEDGTISGWSSVVDPAHALIAVDSSSSGADYTGLALAVNASGQPFLYAADFSRGTIDVFDQNFRPVVRPGAFQDLGLPEGFAPFNIQNINHQLFVTYARQDEDGRDDDPGPGQGFVDVYDADGRLVRRFASGGALNAPWGLALAPSSFGPFGGALLVGNNGDGRITAYDAQSGAALGQLADGTGTPLTIAHLWALAPGNGHAGGDANTLFFAAGIDDEQHGLFGAIQLAQRRGADTGGAGAFDPNAPGEVGDYPLQPGSGPAFRSGTEGRALTTAELLPLRESSLLLVPTLSSVPQAGTRLETPAAASPIADASFSGPVGRAAMAPSSTPVPTAGSGPPAATALALNALLDLSSSPTVAPQTAGLPRLSSGPHAADSARSPLADRDVRPDGLLAEVSLQEQSAPLAEEQDAQAHPPSGPAHFALAGDRVAAEQGAEDKSVETRIGGTWTKLMNLLVVATIPAAWAFWPMQQGRRYSRQRDALPGEDRAG